MTYNNLIAEVECLPISTTSKGIISRIFKQLEKDGYDASEERIRIIFSSLQYLGYGYKMSEELLNDRNIDCSTLTSQSFWEGACIGIPFTAEGQRCSEDGKFIQCNDSRPGDIVIKYPNVASSPDGKHNHVGLVLGKLDNEIYVIESNSKEGCVISTIEKFEPMGGVKNYLAIEKIIINDDDYLHLKAISKRVPKLSRFGAKQYLRHSQERIQHMGVDIYVDRNSKIYSPIDGYLTEIILPNDQTKGIKIISDDGTEIILGNVKLNNKLSKVTKGQILGTPIITLDSRLIYPEFNGMPHVHLEYYKPTCEKKSPNMIEYNGGVYCNALYEIKIGTILSPIKLD